MRKSDWTRRDPIKNYFPLPNEIYSLGLSAGAIAVYGFLMRIENRQTYQCTASYRTIGHATGMSVNTVRKYVVELEERGLITTERTTVTTRDGRILNGCLRYTILPIQQVVEAYHQRQLAEADGMLETWKTQKRLEMYSREGGAPA
ncbi:helix-turn-helix domain-containing protein [uncultured Oscillibacter sp.]|jgi:hypothetical protein|uniref:helix-turn-helix domain-containing protein n=1 Tax=uncultured Oscillibacter sp. TaxID=876091 RepID=UPI0026667A2D|nr:helix-turn-helix domain-containing protein [uncultured Oscillibacter sp.]